ncbi:MAG TPA: hypothetical protein VKF32_03840 [Thermoanaerobaculia bacterium]|nr:hypothetical protein [Thermoanaerobaculia bacterium]
MAAPAWKTAEDVAEGYVTLNVVSLKKFQPHELDQLQRELERVLRDTRTTIVPESDADKAQAKNRRLLRLSQATTVLNSYRSRMGR